mmetsp:Transcript_28566/g.55946  ORF Transcript_28566/g.55946 Transcript_28566/m.55946 type:complete len:92 (+) Transcript_28566:81-356(+)
MSLTASDGSSTKPFNETVLVDTGREDCVSSFQHLREIAVLDARLLAGTPVSSLFVHPPPFSGPTFSFLSSLAQSDQHEKKANDRKERLSAL